MKTNTKAIPLTPKLLRTIIEETASSGFGEMEDTEDRAKDAEETDADEFADSLEQPVDWKKANKLKESDTLDEHISYMKALKIEEHRLNKRLVKVREALAKGAKKLVIAKVV